MEAVIEFKNVSKTYLHGESIFYALHGASFQIHEGELVVILGPSGAGKSTLLNLLGGMDTATEGEIRFRGEEITGFSDRKLTEFRALHVGVVFQFYNLVPTLTAYENVALMKEIIGNSISGGAVLEPEKALEAVGLSGHMHQFPSQMSGGEQQRTSIARAIAKNPDLLLCDEPTGALDTVTGKEILRLLQSMSRKEKKTVIIVTHNNSFAQIANKVIRVKNGAIESIIENKEPEDADEVGW